MAKSGGKQSYAQEKVNTQHEAGEISRIEHGQNEGEVESQVLGTEKKNIVQQESASVGWAKNFRKKPTRTFNYGARRPMLVAQVFKTYEEAKAFMLERGISRIKDYQALQEQHDDLPKNPIKVYAGKWVGWNEFFGIPEFYTLNELQEVVRGLGLTTVRSYQAAQKKIQEFPIHLLWSTKTFRESLSFLEQKNRLTRPLRKPLRHARAWKSIMRTITGADDIWIPACRRVRAKPMAVHSRIGLTSWEWMKLTFGIQQLTVTMRHLKSSWRRSNFYM